MPWGELPRRYLGWALFHLIRFVSDLQMGPWLRKPLESRTGLADYCLLPAADLDFEAILLQPSNPPDKTQVPMVVMPHGRYLPKSPCHPTTPPSWPFMLCFLSAGGPHSSFVTAWMLFPAMLCKMGFAVLLGKSERTCNSTGVHEAMGWPWLYMLFYGVLTL